MQYTATNITLYCNSRMSLSDAMYDPDTLWTANQITVPAARLNTAANQATLYVDRPIPVPNTGEDSDLIWQVDYAKLTIGQATYFYFVMPNTTKRLAARTVVLELLFDSIMTLMKNALAVYVNGRAERIHFREDEDLWWVSETDEPRSQKFPPKTTFQDLDLNPSNTYTHLIASTVDLKYADQISQMLYNAQNDGGVNIPAMLTKPPPVQTHLHIKSGAGDYDMVLGNMLVYNYTVIRRERENATWSIDQGLTTLQSVNMVNEAISDSYLVPSDYIAEEEPSAETPWYPSLTSKYVNLSDPATPAPVPAIRSQLFMPLVPSFDYDETEIGAADMARLNEYKEKCCLKAFYQNITHTLVSWGSGQSTSTSAANLRSSGITPNVAYRNFSGPICPQENKVSLTILSNPGPKGCLYIRYSQLWDIINTNVGSRTHGYHPTAATGISGALEQGISNAGWMSYSLAIRGSTGAVATAIDTYFQKTQNSLQADLYRHQIEGQVRDTNATMAQQLLGSWQGYAGVIANELIGSGIGMTTPPPGATNTTPGFLSYDVKATPIGMLGNISPALQAITEAAYDRTGYAQNLANVMANTQMLRDLEGQKLTTAAQYQAARNYAVAGGNSDPTTAILLNCIVQLRCTFDDPRDVYANCVFFSMYGYAWGQWLRSQNLKNLLADRREYFCYLKMENCFITATGADLSAHTGIITDFALRLEKGVRFWYDQQGNGMSPSMSYFWRNGFKGKPIN